MKNKNRKESQRIHPDQPNAQPSQTSNIVMCYKKNPFFSKKIRTVLPFHTARGSCILRVSNHFTLHFSPVDFLVDFTINFAAHDHIITSDQIKSMLHLRRGLIVFWGPNNSLHGIRQDEVGQLICWKKCTEKCATVHGKNEDLFYIVKVIISILSNLAKLAR